MGRGRVESGPSRIVWVSHSAEETTEIGRELAGELCAGTILAIFGDLGAGKTTLIKGLISELARIPEEDVCSPTFIYMQEYPSTPPVVHYDLYRLDSPQYFYSLGLDEPMGGEAICCIEWADRIEDELPISAAHLTITHESEGCRSIVLERGKE